MLDIQKRRVQAVLLVGFLIIISMTAEKCRELVGRESSSKSGEFTWINCFDMGSGTLACVAKEGVKFYVYNLRAAHVEQVRQKAIERSLQDGLTGGLAIKDATKQAQKDGAKAAKLATRQTKRVIGPILNSGWDFFEALYYGGSIMEGCMRGTGTLVGAYMGGFHGERRLGRVGYLVGSQVGSWFGGRVGLMFYDIGSAVHYLIYGDSSSQINSETPDMSSQENAETYETGDEKVSYMTYSDY